MKIEIQGYWGAEIRSLKKADRAEDPQEFLRKHSYISVCDIVIDGKLRGQVIWDGRYLNILHPLKGAFKVEAKKVE